MHNNYHRVVALGSESAFSQYDGIIIPVLLETSPKFEPINQISPLPTSLPDTLVEEVISYMKKYQTLSLDRDVISFDVRGQRMVIWVWNWKQSQFHILGACRRIIGFFKELRSCQIGIDLTATSLVAARRLADAMTSAWVAYNANLPSYKNGMEESQLKKTPNCLELVVKSQQNVVNSVASFAKHAFYITSGTNLVRTFTAEPPNKLSVKTFIERASQVAQQARLRVRHMSLELLKEKGAEAFLAVSSGSEQSDGGILTLEYTPKKYQGHIVLVGKGVTFDTGGLQLKSANGMYGMHTDMAGAAVVLALVQLAKQQKWPLKVTGYLAISDNLIGPASYKPGSVVKSYNGVTIEIVHTDAEGRLLLADALAIASELNPDLLIDFATLTGAAKTAIGSSYSAVFSNRKWLILKSVEAGNVSGERVWPFPMDSDFAAVLTSQVADVKQCRLGSGPDHIEAAVFLKKFVRQDIDWLHVDLSSMQKSSGLAHIPTEVSGFGVRFASQLIRSFFKKGKFFKPQFNGAKL